LVKLWPARWRETPPSNGNGEITGPIAPIIDSFWDQLWGAMGVGVAWSPRLVDRVWVANRCMQLCCQQIASMPLRFFGGYEPAWVANPDPVWFANGIGDATFSAAWSMYAWGDAFLYITDRYVTGYPSAWTVLDPSYVTVQVVNGRRQYRSALVDLDPADVVQISRDPRGGLRGTSALHAYASQMWGMLAASELGRTMVSSGGVPNAVLKSNRKLNADQAQALQAQWVAARARSAIGAPAVLDPGVDFEQLSFNASDLALLDVMEYDARAIASAFSVPSYMLNMELRGLIYQNPETLFEIWWRSELRPAAGRIQRALSANMLPRGSWVEYDARAVLAPAFPDQVSSWVALEKEGIVTKDEVRAAILHLPPMTQGEAIEELHEPTTAAASPADQTETPEAEAVVTELRPTVWAGTP
jgi:HK97 family phage portal protein